jgi:excisionase family DNA binding protein
MNALQQWYEYVNRVSRPIRAATAGPSSAPAPAGEPAEPAALPRPAGDQQGAGDPRARARRFLAALRPDAALAADLPPLAPAAPDLSVPELRFALPAAPVPRFDHYLEECPGDPVPWNEDPQPWVREVTRRAVEAGWPPAPDRAAVPDRVEAPIDEVAVEVAAAAADGAPALEAEQAGGAGEELLLVLTPPHPLRGYPPLHPRVPGAENLTAPADGEGESILSEPSRDCPPLRCNQAPRLPLSTKSVERAPGGEDAPITCTEVSVTDISPTPPAGESSPPGGDEPGADGLPSTLFRVVPRLPRHWQLLLETPEEGVTQNSYKLPFKETRQELVRRLLDPPLTLEEVARLLGVCPTTVRRYTNRGCLRHYRTPGNQRRFRLSDVLEFMETRAAEIQRDAAADAAAAAERGQATGGETAPPPISGVPAGQPHWSLGP